MDGHHKKSVLPSIVKCQILVEGNENLLLQVRKQYHWYFKKNIEHLSDILNLPGSLLDNFGNHLNEDDPVESHSVKLIKLALTI